MTIRDTAGQDEYEMLQSTWIKEGECFIVCYDITNKSSLMEAENFIEKIKRMKGEKQWHPDFPIWPIILVGCKCDAEDKRKVNKEVGQKAAEKLLFDNGVVPSGYAKYAEKMPYFIEASSKEDINVKLCFEAITRQAKMKRNTVIKKPVTNTGGIFSSISGKDQVDEDLSDFNSLNK